MKILLVENSRTARTILLRQLQSQGYAAEAVGSGKEAIESIKSNNFDVVIMDIFLPEMNGYEAAQHIRGIASPKAQIPIIGFTSSTNERDKKTCLDAGMNEYVIKNNENEALMQVLQQYASRM